LQEYRKGKEALRKYYSSASNWFPLGVKLRLVGQVNNLMNTAARLKGESFRLKQQQFYKNMKAMRSWEITGLDINPGGKNMTLRELLNTIESIKETDTQIFHSVDHSFQAGACIFTFHPDREEEARAMVSSLVPFLVWAVMLGNETLPKHEKQAILSRRVYKHFTDEALERSEGAVWNDTTNTVDSPLDKEIFDLDKMDKEFKMENIAINVDTDDVTLTSLDNRRMNIRPADVDIDDETQSTLVSVASVGTSNTEKSRKSNKSGNSQKQVTNQSDNTTENKSENDLLLSQLLPHMKALALQGGNSAEAILMRKSLEAIEKNSKPLSEARTGVGNT
jgi:hypothetical protein